jgi:hypothetical protein
MSSRRCGTDLEKKGVAVTKVELRAELAGAVAEARPGVAES